MRSARRFLFAPSARFPQAAAQTRGADLTPTATSQWPPIQSSRPVELPPQSMKSNAANNWQTTRIGIIDKLPGQEPFTPLNERFDLIRAEKKWRARQKIKEEDDVIVWEARPEINYRVFIPPSVGVFFPSRQKIVWQSTSGRDQFKEKF